MNLKKKELFKAMKKGIAELMTHSANTIQEPGAIIPEYE